MGTTFRLIGSLIVAAATACTADAGSLTADFTGPTPYVEFDDSPFKTSAEFGFCVETFEDGTFDLPEATGNGSVVGPGGNIDSVDADDGAIDGSGTGGRSYFSGDGSTGIIISFPQDRTNGYPTQIGLVWTDGGGAAPVTFEAFDAGDQSLGTIGPAIHADLSNNGETAEDRFYGVSYASGISKIRISNVGGGIEVDHVQLDRCVVCGDTTFDLRLTATDALNALRVAVGNGTCRLCVCDANGSGATTTGDALAILRKSVGLTQPMNCPACVFTS
jgi:hypothetical protein